VEGIKLIETKYATEKQDKTDLLKSKQGDSAQNKVALASLETGITELETRLNRERTAAQSKANLLSQRIEEVEKASHRLKEEKLRLTEIEERLAIKDFALGEQEALRQLESELAQIDYDSKQHEEVRQQLAGLEQYESPKRKLEEADRLISQEKEALSRAEQATQELRHSLETDSQKRGELSKELVPLPELELDLSQAEVEQEALRTQQRQAPRPSAKREFRPCLLKIRCLKFRMKPTHC
jgi:chromosome segregation ATPase